MKMHVKSLAVAVALLCLLALPSAALAEKQSDADKIDDSVAMVIQATGGDRAVPVIVYAAAGAQSLVSSAVPVGVETTDLPSFDAVAAYLTPAEIAALAADSSVGLITADNPVFGFDYASSLDITNLAIGLDSVAAPADGGPTGAGVGVAVLDTGIATTSDIGDSRIVGWKDFVNKEKTPYDDAGHGTFVAGLIAGDGTASLPLDQGGYAEMQYRGVAPQANIVGVKILDGAGEGRSSAVMAGIIWAVANRDRYNIRVLNLSIGSNPVAPTDFDPIARAVEFAWKNGITVVCAAGNEGEFGPGGILSPGNSPYVITVGATDTQQTPTLDDDRVTYYSSVGPTLWDEIAKPDVVAPGHRLISLRVRDSFIDLHYPENLIPVGSYAPDDPDTDPDYLMLSGTSASAPVAAGVAALMIGEDQTLSPDDVKLRMMATADRLPDASRYQQGAGLIDADEALASDARSQGYALSEDVGDGTTILTEDDYATWAQIAWTKYGWTKFKWTKFKWTKFKWTSVEWTKFKWTKFKWTGADWTKFKWTKFKWTKFKWTGADWTKFKWTKFKWTGADWTKFKWTKFKWTSVAWTKFKWTKFKWTAAEIDWAKFKWTILTEGQ